MARLTRRRFVAATAGAVAVPSLLAGITAFGRALGANDAIRVGVAGLRGRGQLHMAMVSKIPGFRLVALCDPDATVLGTVADNVRKKNPEVRTFQDVRGMLDRKDIDAVTIATPNHWHSLIGVWACQAGKDVYIEKPVSHNVWEGRQLVKAARKFKRMVETGTQARANPDLIEAVAWVRAGNLGKILYARGTCYNPRLSIGKVGKGEIPPRLDYDLWIGPAPTRCSPLSWRIRARNRASRSGIILSDCPPRSATRDPPGRFNHDAAFPRMQTPNGNRMPRCRCL